MAGDLKAYEEAFTPRGTPESVPLITRRWELTNTRYLLGAAGYLGPMNEQLDPGKHRFRIVQRFDVALKPEILQPSQPVRLEEFTVVTNNDGDLALFEFTGALPRAKLYSNWRVNTNDEANLQTLTDLDFDPAGTVLVSTPQKDLAPVSTNENTGIVEYKTYASKHLVFAANSSAPSVLLLNDRYDPHWTVTVDGKQSELLRCNFIMRGVQVPPGKHVVEFYYGQPNPYFWATLSTIIVGMFLSVYLFIATRKKQAGA
jgi:hypothetical protein